jgi:hypothetical protein
MDGGNFTGRHSGTNSDIMSAMPCKSEDESGAVRARVYESDGPVGYIRRDDIWIIEESPACVQAEGMRLRGMGEPGTDPAESLRRMMLEKRWRKQDAADYLCLRSRGFAYQRTYGGIQNPQSGRFTLLVTPCAGYGWAFETRDGETQGQPGFGHGYRTHADAKREALKNVQPTLGDPWLVNMDLILEGLVQGVDLPGDRWKIDKVESLCPGFWELHSAFRPWCTD